MKDLTNKTFQIDNTEYVIVCDGRKGSGSIGHGIVMFNEVGKPKSTDGSCYSLSGCYFYDTKPYFNEKAYNLDH